MGCQCSEACEFRNCMKKRLYFIKLIQRNALKMQWNFSRTVEIVQLIGILQKPIESCEKIINWIYSERFGSNALNLLQYDIMQQILDSILEKMDKI